MVQPSGRYFRFVLSIAFLAVGFLSNAPVSAQRLRKRLEPQVRVGDEIVLSIGTHRKATKFNLVEGPESASITYDKGIMRWTPTEEEIGAQRFAIDFRVKGKKRRVTMTTQVVRELRPEMNAASKQSSSTNDGAGSIPLNKKDNKNATPQALAFVKLPTPKEISCLAMTEDGRFVLLGHQASSQVSVWSVANESFVATLNCESPGDILCRGNRAFVANLGAGTISVVDTSNWKITRELQTPSADQVVLTAPQGRYFQGQILFNALLDRELKLYAIDSIKNRYHDIRVSRHRVPTVSSYSGKFCITQANEGAASILSDRLMRWSRAKRFVNWDATMTIALNCGRYGIVSFGSAQTRFIAAFLLS